MCAQRQRRPFVLCEAVALLLFVLHLLDGVCSDVVPHLFHNTEVFNVGVFLVSATRLIVVNITVCELPLVTDLFFTAFNLIQIDAPRMRIHSKFVQLVYLMVLVICAICH